MDLWGLTPGQARHRLDRQKRVLKWFWTAGLIVLILQGLVAVRAWPAGSIEQANAAPPDSIMPDPTVIEPVRQAGGWQIERMATPDVLLMPAVSPTPVLTATPMPASGPAAQNEQKLSPRRPLLVVLSSDLILDPARTLTLEQFPELLSEQVFVLSGRGPADTSVMIWYRRSELGRTVIDKQGHWQVTLPTAPLARGENELWLGLEQPGQRPQPVRSWAVRFEPWWLDVTPRLQAGLGQGYACAPTALGMAMDYYHQQDPTWPAPPTTELVAELRKKGFVDGYGADAQMICDLAIAYGYSHSFFFRDWSQAHLRQMLDAGYPVIANVRLNLSIDGYGHAVLVIGLSTDGQRVMLLDPLRGMQEAAWSDFERSWASFGPPYCHGIVVRP